jgi:hypothetical protein
MMNKRIIELAKKSGLIKYESDGKMDEAEKFAELIVQECIDIADKAEPYKANDLIRKHFGVEE